MEFDTDKAKIKTLRELHDVLQEIENISTRAQSILIESKCVAKDLMFIVRGILDGAKANSMVCREDGCFKYGIHKHGVDEWLCEEHWKIKVEEVHQDKTNGIPI